MPAPIAAEQTAADTTIFHPQGGGEISCARRVQSQVQVLLLQVPSSRSGMAFHGVLVGHDCWVLFGNLVRLEADGSVASYGIVDSRELPWVPRKEQRKLLGPRPGFYFSRVQRECASSDISCLYSPASLQFDPDTFWTRVAGGEPTHVPDDRELALRAAKEYLQQRPEPPPPTDLSLAPVPGWGGPDRGPEWRGPDWACAVDPRRDPHRQSLLEWRTGPSTLRDLHFGDCTVAGSWSESGFHYALFNEHRRPAGVGVWTVSEVAYIEDRLRWARVLGSVEERPAGVDIAAEPSPASPEDALERFADACAAGDWRLGVWSLRLALPGWLEGMDGYEVLRRCPASRP
jgi:hypothetical protein